MPSRGQNTATEGLQAEDQQQLRLWEEHCQGGKGQTAGAKRQSTETSKGPVLVTQAAKEDRKMCHKTDG